MRPLESGTWIFGTATLAALALAVTSKHSATKSLMYNIATGTGVSAITMYLFDLSDKHKAAAAAAAAARPPIGVPIAMSFPARGSPPAALPGAGVPPGPPAAATPPPPAPAGGTPPPAAPAAPAAPTPPAPAPATPPPAGPNAIGCTPLSSMLPPSAVAQARALLALNLTAVDERGRPTLLSVSTMRGLANDLRGCGSDLGFQPTRDALVKDLEDTATRFEIALAASPAGIRPTPAPALANVLRFA